MKMQKLNLGSGKDYREGYINIDLNPNIYYGSDKKIRVDLIHDLNVFPYPFQDNSIDEIILNSIIIYLDASKCLDEVYRICKDGAKVYIKVPHFSSNLSYISLETGKGFSLLTFESKKYKKIFKTISRKPFLNDKWTRFYEAHLSWIFPIKECEWKLEVVK